MGTDYYGGIMINMWKVLVLVQDKKKSNIIFNDCDISYEIHDQKLYSANY